MARQSPAHTLELSKDRGGPDGRMWLDDGTTNNAEPGDICVRFGDETFIFKPGGTDAATNASPVVVTEIPDQSDAEDDQISLDISQYFSDPNKRGLVFDVSDGPTGITMTAKGVLTGTIDSDANASSPYTVEVGATDSHGARTVDIFTWTIAATA